MSSIFLALPPSAKSQKNMGRTLGCGHFSKSGTTNFFFRGRGGGGGSGSKFGKVNTCNLVFIKFAHCVYFNDYLRSCC